MRRFRFVVLLALLSGAGSAHAQQPIKIVVPLAAGGPVNAMARLVANQMRGPLGSNIVIENRGGAGELRGTLDSKDFRARIERDMAFWRPMLKTLGITAQ